MHSPDTPQLVLLVQCCLRACSYIHFEEEREWEVRLGGIGKTSICPQCGHDTYYTLTEAGKPIGPSLRAKYRDGLDPTTIAPGPRLGPKNKQALLEAKARILKALARTRLITRASTPRVGDRFDRGPLGSIVVTHITATHITTAYSVNGSQGSEDLTLDYYRLLIPTTIDAGHTFTPAEEASPQ